MDGRPAGHGRPRRRCAQPLRRPHQAAGSASALKVNTCGATIPGAHRRRGSRGLDALLTRKGYPGDLAVHVIAGELRAAAEDPAA